jgi:TIR domain
MMPSLGGGGVAELSSRAIFLSYRREDAAPYARLLQFQLRERIPDARVFMDLDSIEAGLDFAEVIREAVDSCTVLVALIGRQWATLTDEEGRRRLDNPDDYVRFEVQAALERGVRVIPVLVDGARPLRQQQLPSDLQKLARLNALELSYGRYEYDADRLLNLLQRVLAAESGTPTGRQSSPTANVEALVDPHEVRPDPNAHLTDAERVAQSITDDYSKASALAANAKALPATDPDRARLITEAERVAQSITDDYSKASALAAIAGALPATDPDRARLITEAERVAQRITNDDRKAKALGAIALALTVTDLDRWNFSLPSRCNAINRGR